MRMIDKPKKGEYPQYADMYMRLVPDDGMVLQHLKTNGNLVKKLFLSLTPKRLLYRYASNKWTLKEILVHLIDDERIYTYRALRFARNDQTELPGFEQDAYAIECGANERSSDDLLKEFALVRRSTIALFNSFDDRVLTRSGVASGN